MFKRASGKPKVEWYPKKASTAIANGALLQPDGSGAVTPGSSTSDFHIGVSLAAIASTDSDYATTRKIPVDILGAEDIFEADVTGTLTTAMVGTWLDLSDSVTVNAAASSNDAVFCVGFISATKGLFKVNSRADTRAAA